MLKIYRNGINRSIAAQLFSSSKPVNTCSFIRSASTTQISTQKWPWAQRQQQPPSLAPQMKPSLSHLQCRCYSFGRSDGPPEQQVPDSMRKIPKMSNEQIHFSAPPFSFIVLNLKAFKIRKYDADFAINEFVEGSKKAVEVRLKSLLK